MVVVCGTYGVVVGKKLERKRSHGRPKHKWEYNIKTEEVGWEGVDWNDVAQDRDSWRALVNAVMNIWVP